MLVVTKVDFVHESCDSLILVKSGCKILKQWMLCHRLLVQHKYNILQQGRAQCD